MNRDIQQPTSNAQHPMKKARVKVTGVGIAG